VLVISSTPKSHATKRSPLGTMFTSSTWGSFGLLEYLPGIGIAYCEMNQSTTTGDVHVPGFVDSDLPIGTASKNVNALHPIRLMNRAGAIQCQHLITRIGKMHHDSVKQPIRAERNPTKLV